MLLSVVLAVALLSEPPAEPPAEPPVPPAPETPAPAPAAKDDPNRMICWREHVVGSNRPEKICMTRKQRDTLLRSERNSTGRRGDRNAPVSGG